MSQHTREHFTTAKHGSDQAARKARDARAKELRRDGWTVVCKRWDFTDLARTIDYALEGSRLARIEGAKP